MYLHPVLIDSVLFTSAVIGQNTLVLVLRHSFENLSNIMIMMVMMIIMKMIMMMMMMMMIVVNKGGLGRNQSGHRDDTT